MDKSLLGIGLLALGASSAAFGTEGRLDSNGCHYDRARGNEYHCHEEVPPNPDRNPAVKKSRENICHGKDSPNYRQVRYFVAYRSMAACVTSGGTEPVR